MKSLNIIEFVGTTLTIIGSFLPWECTGDFFFFCTNGVRIDLLKFKYWLTGIHEFPVYDYGGVLVILLTSVIVLLAIHPPAFIKKPILSNLIVSALLMASSLFFVGRWGIHRYQDLSPFGPTMLESGLVCIVLGSALLLWSTIVTYREVTYQKRAG